MSAKCLDRQGRWRSKTIAFRMSPEEDAQLNIFVKLSGLTKQNYIIHRLLHREVVVQGNPRVYKALKNQLHEVLIELQRIEDSANLNADMIEMIRMITIVMDGMKNGTQST